MKHCQKNSQQERHLSALVLYLQGIFLKFCWYKIKGASEKYKTCRVPFLGLRMSIFVQFLKIFLMSQSL
jgi:hypothetical protein